ncbi:hypothetical protein [Teredinibacter purpureus]|uniref:hypothetical protein n=1 Tax=Teredinibacter purpureus TaxID=2731756 RepID=UPI0005F7B1E4|nr:hypothetical protein [Teredinibacter purpureus]
MAKDNRDTAAAHLLVAAKADGERLTEVDLELLSAFVDGRLNREEANKVKILLASERAWYENWRQLLQAKGVAAPLVEASIPSKARGTGLWRWWLGSGLATACVLSVALMIRPPSLSSVEKDLAFLESEYPITLGAPLASAKGAFSAIDAESSSLTRVERLYSRWQRFTLKHCAAETDHSSPLWVKLEHIYQTLQIEDNSNLQRLVSHGRKALCAITNSDVPKTSFPSSTEKQE